MNDHSDTDDTGDGEGVWSPDIEQCFREALLLFPPCGRRKHILQEEGGGKMYGRNELIARHIRMRTGKIRTRKQVSSHIQVLARRKAKSEASVNGGPAGSDSPASSVNGPVGNVSRADSTLINNQTSEMQQHRQPYYDVWADRPIVTQKIRLVEFSAFVEYRQNQQLLGDVHVAQPLSNQLSSGLANLATAALTMDSSSLSMPGADMILSSGPNPTNVTNTPTIMNSNHLQQNLSQQLPPNQQPSLASAQGIGTSGFTRHSYVKIDYRVPCSRQTYKMERIVLSQIQDKFPEIGGSEGIFQRGPPDAFYLVKFWADLNCDYEYNVDDQNSYFGFSCHFETVEPYKDIICSTKACSYGLQVVEKVEKIYCAFNNTNGRYSFEINRSPMCEFMIQFIKKLRQLPRASQMNSVLENFTVLQEITSESTSEVLLCLAYVFEVASPGQANGSQYHVYKLTKD